MIRPPGTWWAVEWNSVSLLDGDRRYLIWDSPPRLFYTRRECQEYIEKKYGYIRQRPDLRAEPHGWHMPRPVLVNVAVRKPAEYVRQPRSTRLPRCPQCGGLRHRGRSKFCSIACFVASRPTVADRFWSKVDKSGECWVWTGSMDGHGYGAFSIKGRKIVAS